MRDVRVVLLREAISVVGKILDLLVDRDHISGSSFETRLVQLTSLDIRLSIVKSSCPCCECQLDSAEGNNPAELGLSETLTQLLMCFMRATIS